LEGYSIDGTDLSTCLDVIESAVKRARAGRPPQLVVASVLRLSGHGEHDDASYVTDEMKRQPFAQDCLKLAEKKIVDLEMADDATLQSWREDAAKQVDEAIATAQKEAAPDAEKEDWCAISTRELADQHSGADHDSASVRRHERQRPVSQPIDGISLRALSGTDRDDAGNGRRRLHDVDRCGGDR